MSSVTRCDFCDDIAPDLDSTVGWFSVDKEGVDVSSYAQPPWTVQHFCGVSCLRKWALSQETLQAARRQKKTP